MKQKPDNFEDQELRSALHEWKIGAALPPRFQENVWNRIERQTPARPVSLWRWLLAWLESSIAQPALAVAYAIVLLTIGLAGGFLRAQHANAQMDRLIETRYVQSIDPYQK
jgi:hypothetical protein